jgi:hypothetical protein
MRRWNVAPPLRTPPSSTLVDYVQWVDDPDPHWQAGITYPVLCGGASTTTDWCVISGVAGVPNPTKSATSDRDHRGARPFTIYAEMDCSPVGFWDDAENNVRQQFNISESWALERVFWTGDAAGVDELVLPHLAENTQVLDPLDPMIVLQTAASIPVTGTLDIVEGLTALEQYIGDCYTSVALIHAPIAAFEAMVANYLVRQVNGRWQTYKGNWVVPGYGYPGISPAGAAPAAGTTWLYATGALMGYRSGIRQVGSQTDSFVRSVNTLKMIVERTYVLGWDCCHGAVLVSTGGVITGTANAAT